MMGMREKLIELLCDAHGKATDASLFEDASYAQQLETEADHLIANGVTIPRWIPVTERLPESGKYIIVANWDKNHTPRIVKRDALMVEEFWGIARGYYAHGQQVTHWMPLPEPPKGE